MIDRDHDLAVTRQAKLLGLSPAAVYYAPRPVHETDLTLMRRLDALHLELPFAGSRVLRDLLRNVFVERLWRSVKYEAVYLHGYESVSEVRAGLTRYFEFFNQRRPHRELRSRIPDRMYFETLPDLRTPSPRVIPLLVCGGSRTGMYILPDVHRAFVSATLRACRRRLVYSRRGRVPRGNTA